ICGKGPITGSSISHSHRVIKRRFLPNLQKVRIETEEGLKRVYVCAKCLKAGKVQKAV
ncbi:50S ribosomal protein L28, partial [bacterium]|nr:50S ribosomal protein L28 [bacterium]